MKTSRVRQRRDGVSDNSAVPGHATSSEETNPGQEKKTPPPPDRRSRLNGGEELRERRFLDALTTTAVKLVPAYGGDT